MVECLAEDFFDNKEEDLQLLGSENKSESIFPKSNVAEAGSSRGIIFI